VTFPAWGFPAGFPCGLIHDVPSGELRLYYGAADCRIGMASADYEEVLAFVRKHG